MKKNNCVFLTIVIPCYNEEGNIKNGVLEEVFNYLKNQKYRWEVIISDDGSTDKSCELIDKIIRKYNGFHLFRNKHGGKPAAIWGGLKKSKGDYVLFTDMDQSTPLKELEKLLPWVKKYEVVIGSRGSSRKNFPIYRRLGAYIFRTFRKLLMLRELNDTQCGFKLFKREVVLEIFPKLEFFRKEQKRAGWKVTSFDVELLFLLKKYGFAIKEVPVEWEDRDISTSKGSKKGRYFRESKEMLEQIIRVKLNDILGKYNRKS